MFLVECAHYPAKRFTVRAVGTYPGALLSFPRADDVDFYHRYEETKKMMAKGKLSYTGLFNSTLLTPKASSRTETNAQDAFVMDIEAETDRRFLCEKIL